MSNKKTDLSRRSLLKGLAAIPVVAAVGYHGSAAAEMVDPNDPTALSLKYVAKSADPTKHCSNCALWQGGDAAAGGCPIFPGKEVAAEGWCASWVPKPA